MLGLLSPPPPGSSGVQGVVSLGPLCPVQRAGLPCPDRPFEATLVLENAQGVEVARGVAGPDGHYRIALPPGRYILVPQPVMGSPLPSAGPLEVAIESHAWTTLDVTYDSGIR